MPFLEIEIRRLTPGLEEDYARFFDETPHNNGIKCYCVTWRGDASYEGKDHWYPTPEERRARACQFVRDGSLQGYLAYHNGKAVGWCNATGDCRAGVDYLRSFWPIEERREETKVKSVFCFVTAPEMRRKGIAGKLLERVVRDAAEEGYHFVEAYVCREAGADEWRGYLEMYESQGFTVWAEREGRAVVRKELKASWRKEPGEV